MLRRRLLSLDEFILRPVVSLESDLAEARNGIGLAAMALGHNRVALLQHEKLMELDRRLAAKLIEHRQRGSFTSTEVISCLSETAAKV
jgi:hypothetical protein